MKQHEEIVIEGKTYEEFLRAKVPPSLDVGFECSPSEVHPWLKPHQRDIVCWAVKKGRAAIFAAFGLGKSVMQLEIARLICAKVSASRQQEDLFPFCRFLIVVPLAVRQEFVRDAASIGLTVKFVRRIEECEETGLYLTNYETIRDGKLDPRQFTGVSLDEAGILRGFGGTKTFRKFMGLFEGTSIYRFVATATPSPNEFIELLAYAGFLDVMDIGQAKTRFFKRDSTKADVLTIHPHKEREFWLWVSTWAIFLQRPSDLRYSDEGYALPEVEIPFSTQYEYSPSYNDFGHCDDNVHFFRQFDYLTPHLYRILQPGRMCLIHVKDRIVPGGMTGLGFQTVYPFHCATIDHFIKHGFAYLGMKTIVTDVVRENNQTYRLGWTEQCKDGSRMGVGMPEYLLYFRKPPTDSSDGYADLPVIKEKDLYSRTRWQIDAHGFTRSAGNRLLCSSDFVNQPHEKIFKLFREFSQSTVYDFEQHVKLGEALEACGRLPVTFMLLQPQSWHPDVWTDITRMLTLNGSQAAQGREMHLCPMQFDLADRAIVQHTMKGEVVFDPFAGLGTVPLRAVMLGRYGHGVELSGQYFQESIRYLQGAEEKLRIPTLFDLEGEMILA